MDSRLGRRLYAALGAAFLVYLATILAMNLRTMQELRRHLLQSWLAQLEASGALAACDAAPTTWRTESGSWTVRAIADAPVGAGQVLAIPAPSGWVWAGQTRLDRLGPCQCFEVWERSSPIGPDSPMMLANLAARLGLAALLLVALGAGVIRPLVRRVRGLAVATHAIVAQDFQGALPVDRDDELGDVALAFNRAAEIARARLEELRRRDEVTREVLANLSHDVRTPLAALKVALERILAEGATSQLRQIALAEVVYLEGLTENLGALARLEGTALPLVWRTLDLAEIVGRVVERFAFLGRARGVEVLASRPDEALTLTGDALALEQALSNLVHNAVDFAGAHVAVLCFAQGADAVVEVRDDGPGLLWAEVPRLTERHFRGDRGAARGRPGQGLGLAIAAEVARRHDGTLEMHNLTERGSCVCVRLPRHHGSSTVPTSTGSFGSFRLSQRR